MSVNSALTSNKYESKTFRNGSHMVSVFEVLHSLRRDDVLCDIWLQTDDGTLVSGHKLILVSACPYFSHRFNEIKTNLFPLKELDSTALKLLVDFIYTGKIIITEQNVKVLLPAANFLQLQFVKDACVEFLQLQLDPINCLSIRAFADLHHCSELISSSETYIKKHFQDVIKNNEFLSLSSKEMIKLISSNVLNISSEEKVYECVINWARHKIDDRYESLSELIEHVRLPLLSLEYISVNVFQEPLLKNNSKCKDYIIEAFQLNILKTKQHITIPQNIRNTPRQSGHKVILVFSNSKSHWYDPVTKLWQISPVISMRGFFVVLALVKERFVFAINNTLSESKSVKMLDIFLQPPCWVSMARMLTTRAWAGFGVLDDCLYAVGGLGESYNILNSAEVFDISIQKWRMISNMNTTRMELGVGVLNNLLYAIGGFETNVNTLTVLKSVESYDPSLDTWSPVAEMSICRAGVGVGVLDGVMYAVGGHNIDNYDHEQESLKSVEVYRPCSRVWSFIADMHFPRNNPIITLDGLLYVMGGSNEQCLDLDSVEIYNPDTNTWSLETLPENVSRLVCGLVVDKSPYFITT
ncbi:kelch-like protein 2 isoform X2 [Aphis gossypii]|uniref:kelch-like protein 2 isoform X2 n=1 Tax=Aphis gossypii TaxID=80765 RepID=UPI00100E0F15|nr:kelch-like protein 2 isoform X2 [Aphis gossypii]